jgi:hypothetical protein
MEKKPSPDTGDGFFASMSSSSSLRAEPYLSACAEF